MPGVYKIRCKYYGSSQQTLVGPATVTATVITNFGRADERRQALTLRLEAVKDMVDVGEVTIGGGATAAAISLPPRRKAYPAAAASTVGRDRGGIASFSKFAGRRRKKGEGSGVTLLVYRTVEGTEVRLGFGPGLLWARETHQGAERELRLR